MVKYLQVEDTDVNPMSVAGRDMIDGRKQREADGRVKVMREGLKTFQETE
jgi:hypothetical protein